MTTVGLSLVSLFLEKYVPWLTIRSTVVRVYFPFVFFLSATIKKEDFH